MPRVCRPGRGSPRPTPGRRLPSGSDTEDQQIQNLDDSIYSKKWAGPGRGRWSYKFKLDHLRPTSPPPSNVGKFVKCLRCSRSKFVDNSEQTAKHVLRDCVGLSKEQRAQAIEELYHKNPALLSKLGVNYSKDIKTDDDSDQEFKLHIDTCASISNSSIELEQSSSDEPCVPSNITSRKKCTKVKQRRMSSSSSSSTEYASHVEIRNIYQPKLKRKAIVTNFVVDCRDSSIVDPDHTPVPTVPKRKKHKSRSKAAIVDDETKQRYAEHDFTSHAYSKTVVDLNGNTNWRCRAHHHFTYCLARCKTVSTTDLTVLYHWGPWTCRAKDANQIVDDSGVRYLATQTMTAAQIAQYIQHATDNKEYANNTVLDAAPMCYHKDKAQYFLVDCNDSQFGLCSTANHTYKYVFSKDQHGRWDGIIGVYYYVLKYDPDTNQFLYLMNYDKNKVKDHPLLLEATHILNTYKKTNANFPGVAKCLYRLKKLKTPGDIDSAMRTSTLFNWDSGMPYVVVAYTPTISYGTRPKLDPLQVQHRKRIKLAAKIVAKKEITKSTAETANKNMLTWARSLKRSREVLNKKTKKIFRRTKWPKEVDTGPYMNDELLLHYYASPLNSRHNSPEPLNRPCPVHNNKGHVKAVNIDMNTTANADSKHTICSVQSLHTIDEGNVSINLPHISHDIKTEMKTHHDLHKRLIPGQLTMAIEQYIKDRQESSKYKRTDKEQQVPSMLRLSLIDQLPHDAVALQCGNMGRKCVQKLVAHFLRKLPQIVENMKLDVLTQPLSNTTPVTALIECSLPCITRTPRSHRKRERFSPSADVKPAPKVPKPEAVLVKEECNVESSKQAAKPELPVPPVQQQAEHLDIKPITVAQPAVLRAADTNDDGSIDLFHSSPLTAEQVPKRLFIELEEIIKERSVDPIRKIQYLDGELVFAKVKGHPWWPARIITQMPLAQCKVLHHVRFYGTDEEAQVFKDDICPYFENRMPFAFPRTSRQFCAAIWNIEKTYREYGYCGPPLPPTEPVVTQQNGLHENITQVNDIQLCNGYS